MQAVCAKCSRLMCRAVVLFLVAECAQTTPMIAPLPGDPNFSIDGSVAFFKSGESNPTQPNPPPPPRKKKRRGGGEKARKQPTAAKPPANTTRGGQTPPPEGTEHRTPKEAQGDHPAKTGNTKPGTTAQREKGHRNKQKKKKKRTSSPARKKGDGGTGTTRPGTGTPRKKKKKEKKSKKHTPTTQPRRAGHSRDPGPAHTPTPHAGTRNGRGETGRPRNLTRPISRPKPNPNHEHHKQPTLEGQHHKPCPNIPTQDPSQDWQG